MFSAYQKSLLLWEKGDREAVDDECEACGARRPITVRKSVRADTANTLREGDIIELMISDVGKKGDGVGKVFDYLVVVPGTVKGTKVHAKITKISAKTAFAVPTTEPCTR